MLEVLDALKLEKPILVGHSLGGEELSSVAKRYPGRVAALVYLEGGYPYAFDNGKGPKWEEFENLISSAPKAPPPSKSDPALASFSTFQQAYRHAMGFTYPEGELRQQFTTTPEGRVGEEREFPGQAVMLEGMKRYADIPVRALVIFAVPHGHAKWIDESTDSKVRLASRLSMLWLTP